MDIREQEQQIETFTTRGVNILVWGLILAAFVPMLFDADFQSASFGLKASLLGLGLLYGLVTTVGMMAYERNITLWTSILYFGITISLVNLLFYLTIDLGATMWVLLIPVVAQSVALSWWWTILVSATCYFSLVGLLSLYIPFQEAIISTISIAPAIFFAVLFTYIAVRESQTRQKLQTMALQLEEANQQLREYAVQAEELATIKERNRLAREIHDSLGHYLTVVNMQLNAAQAIFDSDRDKAVESLTKAQGLVQAGLKEVRCSVASLRDSPMGNKLLWEAITGLVEETRAMGVVAELDIIGEPRTADSKTTLTLYRAAQEGLTNARKHAHASRIDLALDYGHDDQICLTIVDNGVGSDKTDGGFGLLGLQERIQLLGGRLDIETQPGRGFALKAMLPA